MAQSHMQQTIAILPLATIVLPQGRMELSIFEQRYIRMVKESLQEKRPFGLCFLKANQEDMDKEPVFPCGTKVHIIDFHALADGTLGITVEGDVFFNVKSMVTEADGLHVAEVKFLPPWPTQLDDTTKLQTLLRQRLEEVYATYPEIGDLYDALPSHDLAWLCSRWLELLPLSPEKKHALISSHNPKEIANFLSRLFE